MKNIIKVSLLFVVCSSVFAAQNSNEKQLDLDLSSIEKQQVERLNKLYSVDDDKKPNEDVVISPMGQCEPHPFCQQLER